MNKYSGISQERIMKDIQEKLKGVSSYFTDGVHQNRENDVVGNITNSLYDLMQKSLDPYNLTMNKDAIKVTSKDDNIISVTFTDDIVDPHLLPIFKQRWLEMTGELPPMTYAPTQKLERVIIEVTLDPHIMKEGGLE